VLEKIATTVLSYLISAGLLFTTYFNSVGVYGDDFADVFSCIAAARVIRQFVFLHDAVNLPTAGVLFAELFSR
jgi:hypothetical protein